MVAGNFLDRGLSRIQVLPEVLPLIVVGQGGFASVAFCLGLPTARDRVRRPLSQIRLLRPLS